ncbi:ATP-binding protein [Streptomyces sp. NBC_01335]|uniref:ATP-binding protein n=1 Tax=Streptomyces sp. NBC_01335 TaxID=2903828 RepID=UPI002E0FE7EA|nr:ATP-binding protein [Streptomyces sp. NBC_01335]
MAVVTRDTRLVGEQRHLVAERLARWGVGSGSSADAVLIVSELLSNAMLYGQSNEIGVSVSSSPRETRIEVDDRTPGTWPARACTTDEDENGRGLLLVKALSDAWGIGRNGALVWCTVATDGAP